MLYNKQKHIKYTDMCIYIDNNAYRTDLSEEEESTIFKYLYLITNMFAHKYKFFNSKDQYDSFCLYYATLVFMRFKNPKQFTIKDTGEPKLKKIKSVLNYIKKTIIPKKIKFDQENSQLSKQKLNEEEQENFEFDFTNSTVDKMLNSIDSINIIKFRHYLESVSITIREYLKTIPEYNQDRALWQNIYISCLLSFINSITFTNEELLLLKNKTTNVDKIVDKLYHKESLDPVILFHLDKKFKNYITVLLRELKHVVARDLTILLHEYIPSSNNIKNIIYSEINTLNGVNTTIYDE